MTAATETRLGQDALDIDKPATDDLRLWSVTTVINILHKEALLFWSAEQAALAAIDEQNTWRGMLADGRRDEAVKWLRDARFRRPKTLLSATDLGSVVHSLCESYALTGTRPSKEQTAELVRAKGGNQVDVDAETNLAGRMLVQFDRWLQRAAPSYQATEVCVYSPTFGYAGQADGFLTIDGMRFIIDYKTSREPFDTRGQPKTPYPEQVGLQLALYRWAEFAAVWRPRRFEVFRRRYYALSPAEREMAVPVPEVDGGLCIQITSEACEAYPIRCDEEVHRAGLFALELFRWAQQTSKTAMGPALEFGDS